MLLPTNSEIYFYRRPVDFRNQIDGLVTIISDHLKMNPTDGQIFVFRNKGFDRVKVLYYDRNGFWLLYRRLEDGRFNFPDVDDVTMAINQDQFNWLLSGLSMTEHKPMKACNYSHFY